MDEMAQVLNVSPRTVQGYESTRPTPGLIKARLDQLSRLVELYRSWDGVARSITAVTASPLLEPDEQVRAFNDADRLADEYEAQWEKVLPQILRDRIDGRESVEKF